MANIRPLTPALEKKAREELNETPERIQEDIELLRTWVSKQPHIIARTDDQFLLSFVRSSKHSIERAKKKLECYYTLRSLLPEFFQNRVPYEPKLMDVVRLGVSLALPQSLGEDGPLILIIRPGAYDTKKYNIYDIARVGTIINDIQFIESDNLIVSGLVEVIDLKDVTLQHLFQFDALFMEKMSVASADSSPLRHGGTHFINTPSGFETVFNLFKTFMNEKRLRRLFVHGNDFETFYKHVPQKYLPKEYGGENGSIPEIINNWEKKILEYENRFAEDSKYGVNEELRPRDIVHSEINFGTEGTFRSLNVD